MTGAPARRDGGHPVQARPRTDILSVGDEPHADAAGLSTALVDRSLQELRASGLVDLRAKRLVIRDRRSPADLAVDAIEFGALSAPDGHLAVDWMVAEVEDALPDRLGGEGVLRFAPGGVGCTIRRPPLA